LVLIFVRGLVGSSATVGGQKEQVTWKCSMTLPRIKPGISCIVVHYLNQFHRSPHFRPT